MKTHVLENESLRITVADQGAELISVFDKEENRERLWTADPAIWNRHAPILFPFVGKVTDGKYRVNGAEYSMKTQHGFARDMDGAACLVNIDMGTVGNIERRIKYHVDFVVGSLGFHFLFRRTVTPDKFILAVDGYIRIYRSGIKVGISFVFFDTRHAGVIQFFAVCA